MASHGMPELPQLSSRLAFLDLVNLFSDFTVSYGKSETTEAISCKKKKKKKKFRDPTSGSQPFPWAFFLFATVTSVQRSIAYPGWRVHGQEWTISLKIFILKMQNSCDYLMIL